MSTPTVSSSRGAPLRALKRHHHSPARKDTRKRHRLLNAASAQVTVSITTSQEEQAEENSRVLPKSTSPEMSEASPSTGSCIDHGHGSMGLLCCLPTEVLHLLLAFLDTRALGRLALSSSEVCVAVRNYVYTVTGLRRLLPRAPVQFGDSVSTEDFKKLGECMLWLLIYSCTCMVL